MPGTPLMRYKSHGRLQHHTQTLAFRAQSTIDNSSLNLSEAVSYVSPPNDVSTTSLHVFSYLKQLCIAGKNLVVPKGTFGTDKRAARTEWCALVIFLSVWIPVYIILMVLIVVIYRSGWIEGMSVQTSYVNTLPSPSLIFCPEEISCGIIVNKDTMMNGWSHPFKQYNIDASSIFSKRYENISKLSNIPFILPSGKLQVSFIKFGKRASIEQPIDGKILKVCGCGLCVCLRPSLLKLKIEDNAAIQNEEFNDIITSNNQYKYIKPQHHHHLQHRFFKVQKETLLNDSQYMTPIFESLQTESSEIRAQHQGLFIVKGFFLPTYPPIDYCNRTPHWKSSSLYEESHSIRIGWYGDKVPISHDGFPERPSWISLLISTSTKIYFRVNRVRLYEQGLWSITTVMMHLWAPFLIQYQRYHPKRLDVYAEHHEYRLVLSPMNHIKPIIKEFSMSEFSSHFCKPQFHQNNQTLLYTPLINQTISIPETSLHISVLTFFQQEQCRVGSALSTIATLGLAGVFLVLIHRTGAFFVCFRRHESQHPRLMVTLLLKHISGGHISENHIFGRYDTSLRSSSLQNGASRLTSGLS